MADNVQQLAETIFHTSRGSSLREMAANSNVEFVRTQYHLAIASPRSTGPRITALEAYDQYGWDTLANLADYPMVPLVKSRGEPWESICMRAAELGIDLVRLQKHSGWSASEIQSFGNAQVGFRKLDALASRLGIAAKDLGTRLPEGRDALAARLRSLRAEKELTISEEEVERIAESSWLAHTFRYLSRQYGDFIASSYDSKPIWRRVLKLRDQLGGYAEEPWAVGFRLATDCRNLLGLESGQPIADVGSTIETTFNLLLLHVNTKHRMFGCTVQNDDARAIMISSGNIFLKRMAMAHELCHALFDSDKDLSTLRVDQERVFDQNILERDRVEQRANAFAVELLAPSEAICSMYLENGKNDDAIAKIVSHFGVSQAPVRWQIGNRLQIDIPSTFQRNKRYRFPFDKFIYLDRSVFGRLTHAHVMSNVRPIRRSKLAVMAMELYERKVITADTLASILDYPRGDIRRLCDRVLAMPSMRSLYTETMQI
jgi:hypothetical protein